MKTAAFILAFIFCSLHSASHASNASDAQRQAPSRHAAASGVDRALDQLLAANKGNRAALAAIEQATPEITSNPGKYIEPDGSINMAEIKRTISQHGHGTITLPTGKTSTGKKDGDRKEDNGAR